MCRRAARTRRAHLHAARMQWHEDEEDKKNADADVMLKTVRMMNAADLRTLRTRGREEQWRLLCRQHRWLTL
jgi:hypothetical protein